MAPRAWVLEIPQGRSIVRRKQSRCKQSIIVLLLKAEQ